MIDLSGRRFGSLVALVQDGKTKKREWLWACRCDCGVVKTFLSTNLTRGKSTSCGCYQRDVVSALNRSIAGQGAHLRGSAAYTAWKSMKTVCYNENHRSYPNYGGKGIKVCQRWLKAFENFLADVGDRPGDGYSFRRINKRGNYTPANCRWVKL